MLPMSAPCRRFWQGFRSLSPPPLTKAGVPGRKLAEALKQVRDWRTWLTDNVSYARAELGLKDIDGKCPGYIVIGRRSTCANRRLTAILPCGITSLKAADLAMCSCPLVAERPDSWGSRPSASPRAECSSSPPSEALKGRLQQEARSIADTVLNRLGLQHRGRDLLRVFSGGHNSEILIRLASSEQNKVMKVESGQRQSCDIGQLESAISASPDIADKLSSLIREKMTNVTRKADT
jgi:hypothetical protein